MTKIFRVAALLLALAAGLALSQLSGPQRAYGEDPPQGMCWTSVVGLNQTRPSLTLDATLTLEVDDGPHGPIEWFKLTAQNAQLASGRPETILIKAYVEEGSDASDLNALVLRALLAQGQPREALLYLTTPILQQYLQIQAATVGIRVPPEVIAESGFDPFSLRWQLGKLELIKSSMRKPDVLSSGGYQMWVRDPVLGPRRVEVSELLFPDKAAMDWALDIYYYGPFSNMTDAEWGDYYYLMDWIEDVEQLVEQYYQSLPIEERMKLSQPLPSLRRTLEILPTNIPKYDIIVMRDSGQGAYEGTVNLAQARQLLHTTNLAGMTTSTVEVVRCPYLIDSTVHNTIIGSIPGPAPAGVSVR